MRLIKDKRAVAEGVERSVSEIMVWIILFALAVFAFIWYSGLGSKIISIIKSLF
ncbi:hypothetical protein J4458_01160 [Candidatus Woesearchaeota archaeon]|nr:hypothetical protein [Candidatus Woesearchaeota archaeon]